MVTYFPITQAGRDHLQAEVEQLKHDRPQYIQRLAAAAALGDRSENAEYSAAKRDLRQLEGRLRYLDKLLRYGQLVPAPAGDVAAIGTTVTVSFGPGDEDTYRLVGPVEASMAPSNLASDSPLGQALLEHAAGDTVVVQAPAGDYSVTLVTVRR